MAVGLPPPPHVIAVVLPWQTVTQELTQALHNNKEVNAKENATCVNTYAHNLGTPKYIKQLLTDLLIEINGSTVAEEEINTMSR